jgi:hypothetical protein
MMQWCREGKKKRSWVIPVNRLVEAQSALCSIVGRNLSKRSAWLLYKSYCKTCCVMFVLLVNICTRVMVLFSSYRVTHGVTVLSLTFFIPSNYIRVYSLILIAVFWFQYPYCNVRIVASSMFFCAIIKASSRTLWLKAFPVNLVNINFPIAHPTVRVAGVLFGDEAMPTFQL